MTTHSTRRVHPAWLTIPTGEQGSTIPLVIGLFVIAMLMVAGSVAAGDAFVQQSALESLCDGAAVAAASSADLDTGRQSDAGSDSSDGGLAPLSQPFLALADVQRAVDQYLSRDPARSTVQMMATLGQDRTSVSVACVETSTVAFGSLFGFSGGIRHTATSTARSRLRTD